MNVIQEQEFRVNKKPNPTEEQIARCLLENWSSIMQKESSIKIKKIDSYDDANFYVENEQKRYLVKAYNAIETKNTNFIKGMSCLLDHMAKNLKIPLEFPKIIESDSKSLCYIKECITLDSTQSNIIVRVFKWIDGETLNKQQASSKVFYNIGLGLGAVNESLSGFDHSSFHRSHLWDLFQFNLSIPYLEFVDELDIRLHIQSLYDKFQNEILPLSSDFSYSIILGDCNDANIIMKNDNVLGFIDFSDSVYTFSVNELAIAMAYGLLTNYGKRNPFLTLASLFLGYTHFKHLNEIEIKNLILLVSIRLSISLMVGAYSIKKNPDDEYLKLHAIPAKEVLKWLCAQDFNDFSNFFLEIQKLAEDCPEKVFGSTTDRRGVFNGEAAVLEASITALQLKYFKSHEGLGALI